MTAEAYVHEFEGVMKEFGSYAKIYAATSDNIGACKNARHKTAAKYEKVASVIDRTHVMDRLVEYIGQMEWLTPVIKQVTAICNDLDARPKLR